MKEGGIICIVFFAVIALVVLAVAEERTWQRFKEAHACKLVAQTRGKTVMTSHYVEGKYASGSAYVPGEKTWLCDDGVSYTR